MESDSIGFFQGAVCSDPIPNAEPVAEAEAVAEPDPTGEYFSKRLNKVQSYLLQALIGCRMAWYQV